MANHVVGEVQGIRGIIAPASLKLQLGDKMATPFGMYPGHHRPGFIEAMLAGMVRATISRYPGHHRPGFIEA